MSRIRCHYADCIFVEQGYCAAAAVEIDPEEGCLTYTHKSEISQEQAWKDNESLEDEWAEAGFAAVDPDEAWLETDQEEDLPDDFDIDK